MRALAIVVTASACLIRQYQPGEFVDPVALGCLDVAAHAVRRTEQSGPIVVWELGNRCDHAVEVDLGAATVVAGDPLGHTVATAPYDPEHEIRVLRLDARHYGREWIEYRPSSAMARVAWLDVDVGAVSPEGRTTRWVRATVPEEVSP
jgi:hypothetical protein